MRLNGIFKDNMVLQRDREIRVFGTAEQGENFKAEASVKDEGRILSRAKTADVNPDGSFCITLPPLDAGGPYTLEVSDSAAHKNTVIIRNVFIGEVWLAGGQSNMEYPLGRSENAENAVKTCPVTNIHFYRVPVPAGADSFEAANASWKIIDSSSCYDMSAVAFYFARKLEAEGSRISGADNLHIGVIGCYLGGTSVSCWQSVGSLEKTPEGRRYIEEFEAACCEWKSSEEYLEAHNAYIKAASVYEKLVSDALKASPYMTYLQADEIVGAGPWPPPMGPFSIRRPGFLFERMVLPLLPFGIRGVIFYQGEEDSNKHADDYETVFKSLIKQWRDLWSNDSMPFLFCELPEYLTGEEKTRWDKIKRSQRKVADSLPHAYIASLEGLGETGNIHPANKKSPGERLALLALNNIYGIDDL